MRCGAGVGNAEHVFAIRHVTEECMQSLMREVAGLWVLLAEVRVKQFVRTVSTKYSSKRVEEEEGEEEDGEEEEEESREDERPVSSFARSSQRLPSTREVDEFTALPRSGEEEGAENDHHSAADLDLRHAEEGVKKEGMFGVSEQSLLVPKQVGGLCILIGRRYGNVLGSDRGCFVDVCKNPCKSLKVGGDST